MCGVTCGHAAGPAGSQASCRQYSVLLLPAGHDAAVLLLPTVTRRVCLPAADGSNNVSGATAGGCCCVVQPAAGPAGSCRVCCRLWCLGKRLRPPVQCLLQPKVGVLAGLLVPKCLLVCVSGVCQDCAGALGRTVTTHTPCPPAAQAAGTGVVQVNVRLCVGMQMLFALHCLLGHAARLARVPAVTARCASRAFTLYQGVV
jgi:hypothetical protein